MKKINSPDQQNNLKEIKRIFSQHAPLFDYDKKDKLSQGIIGMKTQNSGLEYHEVFSRIVKSYKTYTDAEEATLLKSIRANNIDKEYVHKQIIDRASSDGMETYVESTKITQFLDNLNLSELVEEDKVF